MERIEIYTNKKKAILTVLGSSAFVALGIWLFINANDIATSHLMTQAIGISCILFFGFGILVGIMRLIKSEIALIIDSKGLNINPKKSSNEFIEWRNIIGFTEIKIQSQRILIIDVTNPDYWMEKETNFIRKKLMQFNLNNYNSPFNLSSSGLDISYAELNEKLNQYFVEYKTK